MTLVNVLMVVTILFMLFLALALVYQLCKLRRK